MSQGSIHSSKGLPSCAKALLLLQTLCSACCVLFLHKNTKKDHTTHDSHNGNEVLRIMQFLAPLAELTSGAFCSTFILCSDYHWGGTRILRIKALLSSSHCHECEPCFSVCTKVFSSFIQPLMRSTTFLAPPNVWPLLKCLRL